MKLINVDELTLSYAGLAKISPYDFEGITKLFYDQIQAARPAEAVPVEWIKNQIKDHPGMHAASWSRLLELWEAEEKVE
jgi:hypothetical protein